VVALGLLGVILLVGVYLGGWRMMAIRSGSMRPDWARGSLLILTKEPASKVRVGQAVVYHPPPNIFNGLIVHQVIAVKRTSPGHYVAQTKGLANPVQDPWKDYLNGNVYKVDVAIPYIGMVPIWMGHI